jgi:hypothetical protein
MFRIRRMISMPFLQDPNSVPKYHAYTRTPRTSSLIVSFKFEVKLRQSIEKFELAAKNLRARNEALNTTRQSYYRNKLPGVLQSMQLIEERRIQLVEKTIDGFVEGLMKVPLQYVQSCESIRQVKSQLIVPVVISAFAETKKTAMHPPENHILE